VGKQRSNRRTNPFRYKFLPINTITLCLFLSGCQGRFFSKSKYQFVINALLTKFVFNNRIAHRGIFPQQMIEKGGFTGLKSLLILLQICSFCFTF